MNETYKLTKDKKKDKIFIINDQINNRSIESKPKLSLRAIASYKFIFYFILFFALIKLITGYPLPLVFVIVASLFFLYNIFKN